VITPSCTGLAGWRCARATGKYIPATTGAGGMGSGANAADARFAAANIPEPLLFDLAKDPAETNNLAAREPQKVEELSALLEKIRKAGAR